MASVYIFLGTKIRANSKSKKQEIQSLEASVLFEGFFRIHLGCSLIAKLQNDLGLGIGLAAKTLLGWQEKASGEMLRSLLLSQEMWDHLGFWDHCVSFQAAKHKSKILKSK